MPPQCIVIRSKIKRPGKVIPWLEARAVTLTKLQTHPFLPTAALEFSCSGELEGTFKHFSGQHETLILSALSESPGQIQGFEISIQFKSL